MLKLKMKSHNQRGIGFLPVMIVVLLVVMSGISYNVYRQQQTAKQQAAQQNIAEPIDTNASLTDIQVQIVDALSPVMITDGTPSKEQVQASLIVKDDVSGYLVQMQQENMATRLSPYSELTESTAAKAYKTLENTLEPYGFEHHSGTNADNLPTDTFSVESVFKRGNDYCYIDSQSMEIGCLTIREADIKNTAKSLQPYYEAASHDYQQMYPGESYPQDESVITINEASKKTIDNKYEMISGGAGGVSNVNGYYRVLGGGRYHFYREIGGTWQVSPSSGNGVSSCADFNTDVLQLLYADQGCWNPETETDSSVAQYWQ